MSDELKPCPFCGGNNITIEHLMDVVFCNDCGAEMSGDAPLGNWNTRPIEDALRAQLTSRDALIERLVGAGIEINSCTKVSTFSAEYYTLCKAQREWNEAVTDWEILKGGEE